MRYWLCLLMLWSLIAQANPTIEYVYDGDTVKIQDGLNQYKLRLSDIDAPERTQTYGQKSRRALMQFCHNKAVQVTPTGIDKYQRTLGRLSCGQEDASNFLVSNGHAWFNRRFSHDGTLATAEDHARAQRLGLWASKHPQAPWEWREKHPHHHEK